MIKNQYKFRTFSYTLNNLIIMPMDMLLALNKFYLTELRSIDPKLKFGIILLLKTEEGELINISSLQISNKTDFIKLEAIFNYFLSYKEDIYKKPIQKIIFRFRFLEFDMAPKNSVYKNPTHFERNEKLLPKFFEDLPYNILFETWGDELIINNDNTYVVNKDNNSFFITKFDNEHHVLLKKYGKELFNFYDIYDIKSTNTFTRIIGSYRLLYINNIYYVIKKP